MNITNGLGENLIFLISQPRAGSTLLQRILAGHPEIHTTAEPWIMLHLLYALKRKGYSAEYDANLARIALDDFCQALKGGERTYIEAIRQMGLLLYNSALADTGKAYFLDKTPRYYFIIPELYRVFPKASYILLFRNPLAVLSSILDTWVGGDWHRLAHHKHDLLTAPQLLTDGIDYLKDDAIIVHYEDLVTNPEQTVRWLCDKLQVEFHPAMLEYGQNPAPKGRMGDTIGIYKHSRPVADYVDKWIQHLASPCARHLAEAYLSSLGPDLLARMGYSFEKLYQDLLSVPCQGKPLDEQSIAKVLSLLGLRPVKNLASVMPSGRNVSSSGISWSNSARGVGLSSPNVDRSIDILVSAIVSCYNSERFIRGCLEDLEAQTIADRLEIIVVDSGSQQNERAIVEEFQQRYGNIVYIRTEERETIYAAWNRAIQIARGKYITNANTDDRHRLDALEIMARTLDAHSEVGLVYADCLITTVPNETFAHNSADRVWQQPDFSLRQTLMYCPFGPQPMWRRSLHQDVGLFDETYTIAGDYEFFLRLAWKYGAYHIRDVLGLYYESSDSLSYANQAEVIREVNRFLGRYRVSIPIEDIYDFLREDPTDIARAAALADFANHLVWFSPYPGLYEAEHFYREAIGIVGKHPAIINNLALVLYFQGRKTEAIKLLQDIAGEYEPASHNLRELISENPIPELQAVTIAHPSLQTLPALVPNTKTRVPITHYPLHQTGSSRLLEDQKSTGALTAKPDNDARISVVWQSPIYDPSGYADEARHFIMHLQAQGVEVAARELGRHSSKFREQLDPQARHWLDRALRQEVRPGCISVVHFPAYAFKRVPQAAYHIGRVMFETDGLPAEWVAKCNQMDEIWVPTDFNLQTFRDAGVTAKLFKVPGGIDTNRFRPGYDPLPISGARGVVFLSIFEWIYRKGWDALLRAWAKAFGPEDDVCLVLRTYPVNAPDAADARREIERRIDHFLEEELGLRREDVASIIVLGEQIPEADMPRLFAAATAYVAPSRGEGWGRPQMQAMACGLPVIATRWSGNLEFMDDENSLLIDIEGLVEIDERAEIPFYRGQRWAEPSVDHLAALLRWVVERPEEAAQIGRRAREDMERHWRWEKVTAIAIERLRAIEAELAQRRQRSSAHPAQAIAVRWEGSLFVYHSLALVNRELCLQLIDAGCELSIIPYEPDQFGPEADPRFWKLAARVNAPLSRPVDVHVRHQWPPNLNPPPEGHWVIIQPWEFGSLPKQWVEVMSTQVDEVWVPSSYVRDCYIRSGVPADRVYVVPNGVDTAKFRPGAPPLALKTKKRFKFLFVGGTIPRKGIDILLDVYMKAFTAEDDVCLVIKDMGGSSFYKGQTAQDLITKCQAMPNAPEIEYIDRTLSDEELVGLYTACDCLVHPYRGEGFGLPIAEAMACGLPVIVTGYGAALDFCTEETAYLVPAREVRLPQKRVGDLETVDYPWWADPDREALKRLMQHVVANPDEAKAKGQAARAHIRAHFTWERAAEVVRKRLQELRDKPIRRLAAEDERATVQELVNELLAEGQAALEQGDLEAAAREFARVVEQYPDLAAAHTALGSTLVALGRIEEAIPHLRRATELAPQAAALHNQLGVALYQMNDLEGAEAAFRRAREADPQDVEALLNLVDLYRIQGRYVEATGAIKEAVEVNPNHLDVLSTFGFMSMEMGDIEGAQIALRRMQAVGPDHPKTQAFAQVLARLAEDGHDGNSVIDSALAASGPSRDH